MTSISATFLAYVEPLLNEAGSPNPGSKEFDAALKIGWMVWNAVIKKDIDNDSTFFDGLSEAVPPPFSLVIDVLVDRKRKEFGEHKFLIGHYEIRNKPDGSRSLFAEARQSSGAQVH